MSIGLPVYNGEEFLAQSIETVLAQTFTDFELVISDNASTGRCSPARNPGREGAPISRARSRRLYRYDAQQGNRKCLYGSEPRFRSEQHVAGPGD